MSLKTDALITHEREKWITHKGKKILYHDYSHLSADQAREAVIQLTESIVSRGIHDLLVLANFKGALSNPGTINTFKEEAAKSRPYTKKTAVIGVSGIVKYFLSVVNRVAKTSAVPFDSKDEALDWLVED